ncbi:MAG: Response regulator PleD [Pelotomaculum sp. PtaB.Bin104]|nr:MAG: Response regulator PleD [Pelotomaculum sp. PtaB.Bin104]
MKLYIVFGNHSEQIANYLASDFEIIGYDRTLDAAVTIAESMTEKPDTFVVLGTALVTGITEGSLNYEKALLKNLKRLRNSCPDSRIKLILSEKTSDSLVESVVKLGIYDIHRVDNLSVEELPKLIETKKNFSNYSERITVTESDVEVKKNEVNIISDEDDQPQKRSILNAAKTLSSKLVKKNIGGVLERVRKRGEVQNDTILGEAGDRDRPQGNSGPPQWFKNHGTGDESCVVVENGHVREVASGEMLDNLGPETKIQQTAETQELSVPTNGDEIYRDTLTECYTRRYLTEQFSCSGHYAVVFIDLDNFKPVNDILGHEAGDRVLAAFGKMLVENLKGCDVAVRWGGDEFVLVLPETTPAEAERVVENLRAAWGKAAPDTGNLKVGFSAVISAGEEVVGNEVDSKKITDKIESAFNDADSQKPGKTLIGKKRSVLKSNQKPTVLLGLGNEEINNWFSNTFCEDLNIVGKVSTLDEFQSSVVEKRPWIVVLSRLGSMGGIPEADKMAEWAAENVPYVIYILGELDEEGIEISDRLKANGVAHIISCPVGGFISTDELVFLIYNIIREVRQGGEVNDQQEKDTTSEKTADTIRILKNGAGKLSQILKQTAGKAVKEKEKKKIRPRVKNYDEGVALEEKETVEVFNENIKNPTAIVPGGVFAIVSPWRPGLAGRLAAQAVKLLSEVEGSEVTYIGASKQSTGAMWLNIPEDELMMSDWRVPGSQCPIKKDNLTIYAVDPAKDLEPESKNETWAILKEARKTAGYTVMDLGGEMDMAMKAAHQGRVVILVILPGADPVELKASQLWLRNLQDGKKNIVTGIDLRGCPPVMPEGIKPKVVVRNNPADALSTAIRRNQDDEFVWN